MTAPVAPSVIAVEARIAAIRARINGPDAGPRPAGAADFDAIMSSATRFGTTRAMTAGAGGVLGGQLTAAVQDYVGIPYVWGGTDPATGLDCSGFTQHLMRRFGVELPRVSADQLRTGTPVADMAAAQPGDLIGWDTGSRNVGADHVAVYLGGGMMAEAPGTGGRVQIVPVDRTPDMIRRVLPSATAPAAGAAPGTSLDGLFRTAGARHGVDPQLLSLVAQKESGFNPAAVSRAGAEGLMQLMPGTARGLGVTDPFDPAQSVDGAARLLRSHLDRYGRVDLALAAYNAGPGNVSRHGGVPPFAETQAYVKWITERYQGDGS